MPGAPDAPEMVTILVPTHEDTGPFGAKSVGEIAINGPAPAVANAILLNYITHGLWIVALVIIILSLRVSKEQREKITGMKRKERRISLIF
jgi:hypothetical protein